jgi:hypothetical protein
MALISAPPPPAAKAPKVPAASLEKCSVEGQRIALLLERDGFEATREWAKRTLGIYRRAVLDGSHFASTPGYRRRYLLSCADFRRWLRLHS